MNIDNELKFYNLRQNFATKHNFITKNVNILQCIRLKLKYYKGNVNSAYDGIVLLVDGHKEPVGGLSDRLSGMISQFAMSKIFNLNYKIYNVSPFDLSVFLIPNHYDWKIDKKDVVYSKRTRLYRLGSNQYWISEYGKIAKKYGQRHIYCNCRYLNRINEYYGTNYTYQELFEELFKPSELLAKDLAEIKKSLPEKYISICFRHSNLFGDFKEYSYSEASDEIKEYVVNVCRKGIEEKINQSGLPAVVTSDSVAFLNRISDMKDVYVFNHNKSISHMDTVKDDTLKSYEQSFLDLYVLGGGVKVFSLQHKYYHRHSSFPELASLCFGKEFVCEWLDDVEPK